MSAFLPPGEANDMELVPAKRSMAAQGPSAGVLRDVKQALRWGRVEIDMETGPLLWYNFKLQSFRTGRGFWKICVKEGLIKSGLREILLQNAAQ